MHDLGLATGTIKCEIDRDRDTCNPYTQLQIEYCQQWKFSATYYFLKYLKHTTKSMIFRKDQFD